MGWLLGYARNTSPSKAKNARAALTQPTGLPGSLAALGDEPGRVLEVAGLIETLGEVLHDGVLGSAPGLRDAGPLNGRNRLGAGKLRRFLGVAEAHAVTDDELQPMVVQAEIAVARIELGELLIGEAEIVQHADRRVLEPRALHRISELGNLLGERALLAPHELAELDLAFLLLPL